MAVAAQATPEAPYVTDQDVTRSYAWLDGRSSQLAHLLVESGCRPGDECALVLPKGADAILAMHGALKAGCAYVPIDTASPLPRLERIVASAEPRLLIGANDTLALVGGSRDPARATSPSACSPTVRRRSHRGVPRALGSTISTGCHRRHRPRATDERTSPTSSSPRDRRGGRRACRFTIATSTAFVEWARAHFDLAADDRVSGHSPFHFDLSTFDIYGAAASGASSSSCRRLLNLLRRDFELHSRVGSSRSGSPSLRR